MPDEVRITISENGPYKVENASSMHYCGQPVELDGGPKWICRCGQSANPPFCDGTHNKVGFDGSNQARRTKEVEVWEGRTLRTRFNPNTCMHVFKCQPLAELREREVAGDDAAAEEIMRVVRTCPSGALSYETKTAEEPTVALFGPEIDIIEGGEVRVQTAFTIDVPLNEHQQPERATLCRCGLSRNKPWCDGRHKARKDFR